MGVPRHRDRIAAVGTVLLAVVVPALLPGPASAAAAIRHPGLIDTHRVVGALVGTAPIVTASGRGGARSISEHLTTISSNLVTAHGEQVTKRGGTAPSIRQQPSKLSVKSGARATFVASANGSPTPTVHWQDSPDGRTWTAIKGADEPTYTFVATAKKEGYRFEAVFKNAAGSATTHAAKLTVISAPIVTLQPSAQSVESGQMASFIAGAAASPTPRVQWEMSTNGSSWTAIGGATTATYSFDATLAQSGEEFEAVFKNSLGQSRSHVATLTVTPAPVAPAVVTQPASGTVDAGATVSLTAAASGSPAPSVQWLASSNGSSWATVPGATSTTYSFAASADESGYQFEAVFTNVAGSATSSPATLTVDVVPTISAQPTAQTVSSGALATFSASATGAPTPSVQWELSTTDGTTWQSIPGATTTTLSFSATGQQSLDQFEAVFSNAAGSVTSAPAILTVTQGPTLSYASNWSGYAAYNSSSTTTTFTAVSSSWTVPTVSCSGTASAFAAEWVGIDGYSQGASSVEQDGTDTDCINGTPTYYAWFEMYGDENEFGGDEVELRPSADPVAPGDDVAASVGVVNNTWTLTLTDSSAGWSYATAVEFTAAELSAEWVLERPELCTSTCTLPALADFGSFTFTNAQATSTQGTGSIDVFVNAEIEMLGNTNNVLAAPGVLNASGTSFTDTWSGSS